MPMRSHLSEYYDKEFNEVHPCSIKLEAVNVLGINLFKSRVVKDEQPWKV